MRVAKSAIVLLVGLAIALPLLKYLADCRESSLRGLCNGNLTQIGLAMLIYAADHGDRFPQGETGAEVIAKLIEEGYLQAKEEGALYVCPGAAGGMDEWERARKLTAENCSYEFVPGVNADSHRDFMVAFDKSPDNHWTRFLLLARSGRRGRNVLFADGHVSFILEDEFQQRMAWQREMTKRLQEGADLVPFQKWREGDDATK